MSTKVELVLHGAAWRWLVRTDEEPYSTAGAESTTLINSVRLHIVHNEQAPTLAGDWSTSLRMPTATNHIVHVDQNHLRNIETCVVVRCYKTIVLFKKLLLPDSSEIWIRCRRTGEILQKMTIHEVRTEFSC